MLNLVCSVCLVCIPYMHTGCIELLYLFTSREEKTFYITHTLSFFFSSPRKNNINLFIKSDKRKYIIPEQNIRYSFLSPYLSSLVIPFYLFCHPPGYQESYTTDTSTLDILSHQSIIINPFIQKKKHRLFFSVIYITSTSSLYLYSPSIFQPTRH